MAGNPGPAITTGANSQVGYFGTVGPRLLGKYIGVNANTTTTDYQIPLINTGIYSPITIIYCNASISLTTATAGLFSSVGGSGTITADAALSGMTTALKVVKPAVTTDILSGDYMYLRVGTAQGAAATFDVYVYGYDLNGTNQ